MDIDKIKSERIAQFGINHAEYFGIAGDNVKKYHAAIDAFATSLVKEIAAREEERAKQENKLKEVADYIPLAAQMKSMASNPIVQDFQASINMLQAPVGDVERMLKIIFTLLKTDIEARNNKDVFELLAEADNKDEKDESGDSPTAPKRGRRKRVDA